MKINLRQLKNSYYEAVAINAAQANDVIKIGQGWLLTLALAEMAFAGTMFLNENMVSRKAFGYLPVSVLLVMAIVILLLNFISFFAGSYYQFKHLVEHARKYHELMIKVRKHIAKAGVDEVDELPEDLSDDGINKIKTSDKANLCFNLSFLAVGLATLILILTAFGSLFRDKTREFHDFYDYRPAPLIGR